MLISLLKLIATTKHCRCQNINGFKKQLKTLLKERLLINNGDVLWAQEIQEYEEASPSLYSSPCLIFSCLSRILGNMNNFARPSIIIRMFLLCCVPPQRIYAKFQWISVLKKKKKVHQVSTELPGVVFCLAKVFLYKLLHTKHAAKSAYREINGTRTF